MKIQGIYKIVNKINNKVYIGQSINIEKRIKKHKYNALIKNIKHPLYDSIRKYSIDNFEFIILEEIKDINELDLRELYWINHYKSNDLNYGYNLRLDCRTNKGFKHSKQSKLNMSLSQTGKKLSIEHRKILSLSNKGKPKSEEHKLKLSESHKGKIVSKETREKLSKSHKGKKRKPLSKKHKLNISLGNKNKTLTNEHIKNLKKAWKLRKLKNIFK